MPLLRFRIFEKFELHKKHRGREKVYVRFVWPLLPKFDCLTSFHVMFGMLWSERQVHHSGIRQLSQNPTHDLFPFSNPMKIPPVKGKTNLHPQLSRTLCPQLNAPEPAHPLYLKPNTS